MDENILSNEKLLYAIETINNYHIPKNSQLEIECRYMLDERKQGLKISHFSLKESRRIIENLIKNTDVKSVKSVDIEQTINFIKDSNQIKQLVFMDGVQQKNEQKFYKKVKIANPVFCKFGYLIGFKFSASYEEKIPEFPTADCSHARIRLRYSIKMIDWNVDITLVKNLENLADIELTKKFKKQMLFPISAINFCEKAPWDIADVIELEAEFTGKKITINHIVEINKIIQPKADTEQLQIADIISKIAHLMDKPYARTISQIGNKPIEMSKINWNEIADEIYNWYITDKVDGQRTICYMDVDADVAYAVSDSLVDITELINMKQDKNSQIKSKLRTKLIRQIKSANTKSPTKSAIKSPTKSAIKSPTKSANTKLANVKSANAIEDIANIKITDEDTDNKINKVGDNKYIYIVYTEFYDTCYYIFDVMYFEGRSVLHEPFSKRLKYIEKIINRFGGKFAGKAFLQLTTDYIKDFAKFKKRKINYKTDG